MGDDVWPPLGGDGPKTAEYMLIGLTADQVKIDEVKAAWKRK